MIEVEKRFTLPDVETEQRLIAGATFIAHEKHTDTYYDSDTYALTLNDRWLRQRDGAWELKDPVVPIDARGASTFGSQYRELSDDTALRTALQLPPTMLFAAAVHAAGYHPICTFTTERKKYVRDGFTIVIDTVDFGYHLAEIELMVATTEESARASDRIRTFVQSLGLSLDPVGGKMYEWFKRNNPAHFTTLLQRGVFRGRTEVDN